MVDQNRPHLPWDELNHTEGDIPWTAIERFAQALGKDPTLWKDLAEAFSESRVEMVSQPTYIDLYIPAILALGAPKLEELTRWEIAEYFVDELLLAADDQDEVTTGELTEMLGRLGPAILPAVLDALADEPHAVGAAHLWTLTALTEDSKIGPLRRRVVAACEDALRGAMQSAELARPPVAPAWTLACLNHRDSIPLIRQVADRLESPELSEVVDWMEGRSSVDPPPKPGQADIREWLESDVAFLCDWYTARLAERGAPPLPRRPAVGTPGLTPASTRGSSKPSVPRTTTSPDPDVHRGRGSPARPRRRSQRPPPA